MFKMYPPWFLIVFGLLGLGTVIAKRINVIAIVPDILWIALGIWQLRRRAKRADQERGTRGEL